MRVHKKKHGAERLEACGNIVIKDLKAVEGLGCVSIICSDKTGTLTNGVFEVTVPEHNIRLFSIFVYFMPL